MLPFVVCFMLCQCSGTTETIFETKTHLFDVMVKDNDITIVDSSNDEHLDSIVHVSRADEQRLADLNIKRYVTSHT